MAEMDDKKIRALLIEDNPGDARLIREMLADGNHTPRFELEWVDRLSSGAERLAAGDIDVVLLDLALPDSDPSETFIRARSSARGLPIIVLTVTEDDARAIRAMQEGAQDYLVKADLDGNYLRRSLRYAIERKRAQEELESLNVALEHRLAELKATTVSKAYLDNIIESMAETLLVISLDGTIQRVNQAAVELLGYERDELIGASGGLIFKGREGVLFLFLHSRIKGVIRGVESNLVTKDGRDVPVALSAAVMRDDDGEVQGVVALAQDLSEQKRTEEELRKADDSLEFEISQRQTVVTQLEATKANFSSIVEKTNDAILILDKEGIVLFANPAAEVLLGREKEELVSEPLGFPVVAGDTTEFNVNRNGEEERVAEMRVDETEWRGRHAYLATLRDITERKRLLAEAKHANEGLRKANLIKDDFIANVSHELRTPLATISNILGNALAGVWGDLSPQAQDELSTGHTNAKRLATIVGNLLDMSTIKSGKVSLDKSLVDIPALVRSVIASVKPDAIEKSIELTVSHDEVIGEVFCDKIKVVRILNNLIGNALKFTESGGSIAVTVKDREDSVEVSVTDTGIGIAEENKAAIFERFHQIDRSVGDGAKGTGLGLAIVKKLVELHRGEMRVESEQGEGSTFSFTLPKYSKEEMLRETIQVESEKYRQREGHFSMVVIACKAEDLKTLEEEHGNGASARMLKEVEARVRRVPRSRYDVFIPYGNGKMIVFLPDTPKEKVAPVRDRIQQVLDEYQDRCAFVARTLSYPENAREPEGLVEVVENMLEDMANG